MTAATLPPGAARMPALPMAPGDQADMVARLAEKAKEDVLVTLLGALRSFATAVTVTAQRLQAMQEEAASVAACSQGLSRPSGGKQAEEFLLDDDEDSPLVGSACIHDLEAEYDLLDAAATSSAAARQPWQPSDFDMVERLHELLSAVGPDTAGPAAAPPVDHEFLLAQAAAMAAAPATATASAASSAAAACFAGPAFEPPDLPVSRSRLDDEVACGRCGSSSDVVWGPPRTAGRIRIGKAEFGWLCYECTAVCHREIGYHDEARMQELMAKAAARPRCPAESSATGSDAAHARCGPSWLVPAAQGMAAAEEEETEAHGVACSGRLPRVAKAEAEAADNAEELEDGSGARSAAASPAAPPAEGEGIIRAAEEGKEVASSDEDRRLWIEAQTQQASALGAQPPVASSQPLAAAGRPPAAAGAAWHEEEAVARGAEEEQESARSAEEEASARGAEEEAVARGAQEEAVARGAQEEEAVARSTEEEEASARGAEEEAVARGAEEEARARGAEEEAGARGAEEEAVARGAEEEASARGAEEAVARGAEEKEARARAAEEEASAEAAMEDNSMIFKEQEEEGSTMDAGQMEAEAATDDSMTFKEQDSAIFREQEEEEDSMDAAQLEAEERAYFRQLSGETSAELPDEDSEVLAAAEGSAEPAAGEAFAGLRQLSAGSSAPVLVEEQKVVAAEVKAELAASSEEVSTADSDKAAEEVSEESSAPAQAPADAEYYVLCFAKNWQRESPMRPVKAEAACDYANVGGTWLAHRLDIRFNARTTKFQICGDWTKCRAIWSGAVRDEPAMDANEVAQSRVTWPTLELQGPALPATLRTSSQQVLKGLDWIASRPPGGGAVAILYNPEKELILCRPAEDVEELRDEVAGAQEEREKGLYLVRGSEGWEIPDGQGPMSKEVDANGDHQLVQAITLPPGSSSEHLRILRDGRAEERFAPLVTDMPDSHVLRPNGPERPGDWIAAQPRTWPPLQEWLVHAEEGATVQIVFQGQAKRLLCRPCEEPKQAQSIGEEPKQVRAGRWSTLAARGGSPLRPHALDDDLAAVAAAAVSGAADGPEGARGEEERSQWAPQDSEKDLEEAFLAAEGPQWSEQQSWATDELERLLESSWTTAAVESVALPPVEEAAEWGAKEPVVKPLQSWEPGVSPGDGANLWQEAFLGGAAEALPFEPREEAATGDSVDWAAEATVEELVQRMDLDGLSAEGSQVTLELEIEAYTAAIALARVCEAGLEAREQALAAGAAKVLARLFPRGSRPSTDAGDEEAKLMVATARETARFAWDTLPTQASEEGAQVDAAAREVVRATTWDTQGHFEVLEQECLGVLGARHAAEEPRRRRGSSWPRTLSFAKVKLGAHCLPIRDGTADEPFRIWVFGATDEVEVALAEEGYFEDANLADSAPTEVVLLGNRLRDLEVAPGRADGAVVRTMSYEELRWRRCLGAPLPDLAAALMPGADGQGLPPDKLLDAIEGVPTVVSMRFQLDESGLLALKKKMARGRLLWKPTPCPFSSCPEGSAAAFADNGWTLAVQGPGTLKRVWTVGAPHVAPPGEPRPKAELIPACFWGILDIKYDTSRPVLERVKVLETGDGKTSKFSGDGSDLKRRYVEKYKPSEDSSIAMYEVISADKLLTHDLTADNGYEHVLPKQACFEKRYKPDLAEHIASELGLKNDSDLAILKLCNRTRGAGVVVVPRCELDDKLRRLLQPPPDLEAWFQIHKSSAFKGDRLDLGIGHHASFQEQERHWWSNECPVFVAETCESSLPTVKNSQHYDGTLRAGFVLRRRGSAVPKVSGQEKARKAMVKARQTGEPLPDLLEEDGEQVSTGSQAEDFEIDWLGCYWKLPKKPRKSLSESSREAIVSAARTSGTAQVHAAHCHEVYAALGDLVPRLFCTPEFQPEKLVERYRPYPGLPSYLTASLSASMKRQKLRRARTRAEELLQKASIMLTREEDSRGVELAHSFVHREFCSCLARQQSGQQWGLAVRKHNQESLRFMPTNATSLYIKGMTMLQSGHLWEAEKPLMYSLLLDPDFKLAYVQLGICYLRQEEWKRAIAVCEAGLERNPQQPQFKYHLGLAYYRKSCNLLDPIKVEDIRQKALEYLRAARSSPEARKVAKDCAPFSMQDEQIVKALERASVPLEDVKLPAKTGWVCASVRI